MNNRDIRDIERNKRTIERLHKRAVTNLTNYEKRHDRTEERKERQRERLLDRNEKRVESLNKSFKKIKDKYIKGINNKKEYIIDLNDLINTHSGDNIDENIEDVLKTIKKEIAFLKNKNGGKKKKTKKIR